MSQQNTQSTLECVLSDVLYCNKKYKDFVLTQLCFVSNSKYPKGITNVHLSIYLLYHSAGSKYKIREITITEPIKVPKKYKNKGKYQQQHTL